MRTSNLRLTLGLALGFFGCGDDNTATPDAAKPPIDAPKTVDGPVTPTFKGFDADEGGEVRMEYIRFAAGNSATRATAFAYANPGSVKFHTYPNLNGCTDVSTDMNWPTASNPVAERTYLDTGKVLVSGGPTTLDIEKKATMFTDPIGRAHPADAVHFHFGGGMATDGATYLSEKTSYDVTFTGSADMPAQIFDDVLYMPADYAVLAPGLTSLAIPAATEQTFTWTTPPDIMPGGETITSLVGFTGPNGPAVLCIELNDGSITVPAAMIDIARAAYPQGGTLARQTLTHVVRELVDKNGPTGKRIDFISVWCYATAFTVP